MSKQSTNITPLVFTGVALIGAYCLLKGSKNHTNVIVPLCDSTGTLTGNQNVIKDRIQIVLPAPFYDTGATADVDTSTILSTVITQLT